MWDSFKKHLKDMLSGRYGTISSARVMMVVFGAVAIGILIAVFHHMMQIDRPELLAVWIGGLPAIGGILIGLVAAPYTVNKGANSISDLFSMMVNAKAGIMNVASGIQQAQADPGNASTPQGNQKG